MGFCSAVTLAFATIFSLVAVALLAIAFSTDNWITISVDRSKLQVSWARGESAIHWINQPANTGVITTSIQPILPRCTARPQCTE